MPKYCTKFTKVLLNFGEKENRLVRTRCKQWSCSYCASINRKIWRAFIIKRLNDDDMKDKVWCFATITMPKWVHAKATPEEKLASSIDHYRKNWDVFMKRLKRRYGNFSYIRSIESHKSGVLHIHLMLSVHLSDVREHGKQVYSEEFKAQLLASGFGYITHQQNIIADERGSVGLVASYITKYMTKETAQFAKAVHGKRVRRIQTSRDFGTPKLETSGQWMLANGVYEYEFYQAAEDGKTWIDINENHQLSGDDFEDDGIYPSKLL